MWIHSLINAICDGNDMYDELYGDTAVYLDVEDVVQSVGSEFNVESVSALFGFTNANDYADLAAHLSNVPMGYLLGVKSLWGFLYKLMAFVP